MSRWMMLALFLGACGGGTSDADSGSGGVSGACDGDIGLELGTGDAAYEPLTDGEELVTVHGPQGGWHIWTAVDVTNSEPEVSIRPTITVPDFGIQVSGNQQAQFVALSSYDEATCHGQFYGMRSFVDTDAAALDALCTGGFAPACDGAQALICAIAGHQLDFSVTVTDIVDGRSATASKPVTAALDPLDVPNCP